MREATEVRHAYAYRLCFASMLLALVSASGLAQTQGYPNRPIKVIVPFAAGGGLDSVARIVGQEMSKGLGQPMHVEHRPGGAGTVGAAAAARAEPDGYTLMVMPGGHPIYGATRKSLPFDVVKSFDFISTVTTVPLVIVVRSDSQIRTLADLIAEAKARPGAITFGNAGTGSTHHLTIELIANRTGTKFVGVPYQGEVAATTGLLGGQTDFLIVTPTQILAHLEQGTVRVLAVSGNTRFAKLPNAPTVEEAIGLNGFNVRSWFGFAGPAGMPKAVIDLLNAEMRKALTVPDVRERLENIGGEIAPSTPQEFRDRVIRELRMWNDIVEASGFQRL
jgi:tripartite-type tricarboxylate transporter receptor subunit TctC